MVGGKVRKCNPRRARVVPRQGRRARTTALQSRPDVSGEPSYGSCPPERSCGGEILDESRCAPALQGVRPNADEQKLTLDELDKLLREARSPQELFGDDLDAVLRRFRAVCHPDRNPGDPRAERLYLALHVLAEQARRPPVTI